MEGGARGDLRGSPFPKYLMPSQLHGTTASIEGPNKATLETGIPEKLLSGKRELLESASPQLLCSNDAISIILAPDLLRIFPYTPQFLMSPAFIIILLLLGGLTVNAKDGWDRWIYGALTVLTAVVLMRCGEIPSPSDWRF